MTSHPPHSTSADTSDIVRCDRSTSVELKYTHTNIVARDWRSLAKFYEDGLGCVPLLPQRNYRGNWINEVTALTEEVTLEGIHLRLPGYGDDGPTLEIFQYSRQPQRSPTAANQPGFTHIAFHVNDVSAARSKILTAGGHDLGKLHSMEVPGAGTITLIYMTDPEGNIIELQLWSK